MLLYTDTHIQHYIPYSTGTDWYQVTNYHLQVDSSDPVHLSLLV